LNPQTKIYNQDFSQINLPDNYFDLVIGNVPFGAYKVHDPRYNALSLSIHNYFIAKSLDLVKEGGVICLITSPSTLDSKNAKFREYLAKKSELITAFRLPSEAFKTSSNTEVSADVLILKSVLIPMTWDSAINTKEYSYSQQNFLTYLGVKISAQILVCNEYWLKNYKGALGNSLALTLSGILTHKLLGLPTVNKLYGHGLSCSDNKGSYNFLEGIKDVPVPSNLFNLEVKKDEVILIPQSLQSAKLNSFVIFNNGGLHPRSG
jgi:hypothetical protein